LDLLGRLRSQVKDMSRRRKVLLALGVAIVVVLVGFVIWAETPLGPMPEALAALESDSQVQVSSGRWLVFTPASRQSKTGFIIYPGGRVDARSYAPAAHTIAEQGFLAVIVPMPLNLAVFAPDSALEVISVFQNVTTWAVGGHSLGGAMAAQFAKNHPSSVQGLILWAAYPDSGSDLSESHVKVVSISATRDGLATPDKIASSRPLLPSSTNWIEIVGGNHAQFGWYGPQPGDNSADISREAQQKQTMDATLQLLEELEMLET